MTDQEINKAVALKLGLPWHEWRIIYNSGLVVVDKWECNCGETGIMPTGDWHCMKSNPDFLSNAAVLIRELKKRNKLYIKGSNSGFIYKIGTVGFCLHDAGNFYINFDYILNPRQLCEEYLRWEGK